ncbi:MAG: hypothetical protein L6Q54_11585 [Leptospiraceae bacterium]|nr:hypothetical protein [Leptospiraceae bacterium]
MNRPTTNQGFQIGECASALQKAIRRGIEDDALYWGVELYKSGFSEYAWKRIRIITSEDIGIADLHAVNTISNLYNMHQELKKKNDETHAPERLFFIHAIIFLVRCKKSRIVDHALMCYFETDEHRDLPDYAYDMHTLQGKKMGRGIDHFFAEGAMLKDCEIDDPYRELGYKIRKRNGQPMKNLFE